SSGTLTVRLDGTLGDLTTKDHVLSGAELTTPVNDNIVQDVLVDNIGASYNSEDGFSEDLDIVFTERLVGDHDNNGIVNINDITPVATLAMDHSYDPPIEWEFDDPFLVQSASYESSNPDSLWIKMLDPDWYDDDHDLDLFYLADSSS